MEKVDLDLNNYTLNDLLHLFHIPSNFDEDDLRSAKKIVLMTHPDKSKLDAKYFRFYSQAYKQLFSLWEFKNKQQNKNKSFQIDDNRKENHKREHSL
jgi:curved DNA-binding protein CbpA